jgi:hypothetical protein
MSWWGILVCFLGVRQSRDVPHMTLTCERVAGTHHGRGEDDREYARGLAEEGACDACPRERTAGAKQVRL